MEHENLNEQRNGNDLLAVVRRSFLEWVAEYKPDLVSRSILSGLLYKYEKGDKEPLFKKFQQLADSEHYKLAEIFCSCFKRVGINNEFLAWVNYA